MKDEKRRSGSNTGDLHGSTGVGEGRITGSGAKHDSRLGGGGPVGDDKVRDEDARNS